MPKMSFALPAAIVAAGLAFAAPAFADAPEAEATLKDVDGNTVGEVDLEETPHGVLLDVELKGFPPGDHAFHIHAVGKCEPPFKSAGGHFNPTDVEHGYFSKTGPHAGDMPNIHVPASGKLDFEVFNPMVTFNGDNALFDEDGAAIMIHDGEDDYESQPSGDAGSRIACGVITAD
ncbi:superoxide dismutase family protein [Methyloligella sp. 2.7D]|uniref:superoxide dismutase family protein n=1 Tax=unclassified Methyloligella TaxID=2625955 RepID=UPI00157CC2D2|nr:superoxide dismutase family protein [Methyloligella sp. GL2]QKP76390.1 superoxide dismutase family protein [Methyloligella sp. GL2]